MHTFEDEPVRPPQRSWWSWATPVACLTVLAVLILRGYVGGSWPAPWSLVGALILLLVAAFSFLREGQNTFWGLVLAGLLLSHPAAWRWVTPYESAWWAEALTLTVL